MCPRSEYVTKRVFSGGGGGGHMYSHFAPAHSRLGVAVVYATKMPTQYILARQYMRVQCDGTVADVKMLPAFTRSDPLGASRMCFTMFWKVTRSCSWWC